MPRLKILTRSTALRASFSLVAVLLMTACAPAATVAPLPAAASATMGTPPLVATQTPEMATQSPAQPEAATAIPVAVATSRGPDLEATDPTTVSLASGQLQLVEFFRFT